MKSPTIIGGHCGKGAVSRAVIWRRMMPPPRYGVKILYVHSWHENLKKRQVKSPKLYIRDSGLLHALLELGSFHALSGHPKIGASFEGFVIEQLLSSLDTKSESFWATHGGAELDLLVAVAGQRYGFECKYSDVPGTTQSMHVAINDLQLSHLWGIYPGNEMYKLDDKISVLSASHIPRLVRQQLS